MVSGDFDRDGADDVALLKSDSTIHILWATKSDETLVEFDTTDLSLPAGDVQCITAADCTNDGTLDIIVGTGTGNLYIIPGESERSWGEYVTISGLSASHIAVGDLDGDSYMDIITTIQKIKFIDDDLIVIDRLI